MLERYMSPEELATEPTDWTLGYDAWIKVQDEMSEAWVQAAEDENEAYVQAQEEFERMIASGEMDEPYWPEVDEGETNFGIYNSGFSIT